MAGPFASSVGVGRAEPEWASLNKVAGIVGCDKFAKDGETSEAPLKLPEVHALDAERCPLGGNHSACDRREIPQMPIGCVAGERSW